MPIDFGALRQRKGSNMAALQKKLEDTGQAGGGKKDERIWKPKANSENIAECIIRFLPIPKVDMEAVEAGTLPEENLTPAAKIISHFFKGPNGYYVENSPSTFGEPCPVGQYNSEQWGISETMTDKLAAEAIQNQVKNRGRRIGYYANIEVIRDKNHPEFDGKVMLYQYGETIRKILDEAISPKFEADPAFDPFDLWEGANLKLNLSYEEKTIRGKKCLVPVFDGVKWAEPSPAFGGDEDKMNEVWGQEYSIAEFYNRKDFKSFEVLQTKFFKVMGLDAATSTSRESIDTPEEKVDSQGTAPEPTPQKAPSTSVQSTKKEPEEAKQEEASGSAVATSLDEFDDLLAELEN
ncbi:MAG: hypothetical protein KAS32_23690 [Candidatus Peribacteraceae bacterium]|nr:hypothetical protein [Candidatus Peribacteraceae bacterium]